MDFGPCGFWGPPILQNYPPPNCNKLPVDLWEVAQSAKQKRRECITASELKSPKKTKNYKEINRNPHQMESHSWKLMEIAKPKPSGSSSMPLVSRLDHLDFIMKYLERKHKFQRMGGNNSSTSSSGLREIRQCMPMDLALKEASLKGSLLDRVASLEHRLSQLCLEMESSSGTSRTSSWTTTCTQTSGDNSSQGSKGESSCSFPTFSTPYSGNIKPTPQTHFTRFEIQEDSNRDQQKRKHPSPPKQKLRKNRPNNDEISYKRGKLKTRAPPTWPHLKLLGC